MRRSSPGGVHPGPLFQTTTATFSDSDSKEENTGHLHSTMCGGSSQRETIFAPGSATRIMHVRPRKVRAAIVPTVNTSVCRASLSSENTPSFWFGPRVFGGPSLDPRLACATGPSSGNFHRVLRPLPLGLTFDPHHARPRKVRAATVFTVDTSVCRASLSLENTTFFFFGPRVFGGPSLDPRPACATAGFPER